MLCHEHLNRLRHFELEALITYLTPDTRILEIGGGSGAQAQMLTEHGFDVESIDVDESQYKAHRVFPVVSYDGKKIPFPDRSFDIVYSSNVLEHVSDLTTMHAEIRRVLRPEGYALHIMPSTSWRFWTSVAHYCEISQKLGQMIKAAIVFTGGTEPRASVSALPRTALKTLMHQPLPPRHGEFGNVLTEHVTFSRRVWKSHFVNHGFRILLAKPMGLFYTGHMILGSRWSFKSRQGMAKWLGSACSLYKVKPLDASQCSTA